MSAEGRATDGWTSSGFQSVRAAFDEVDFGAGGGAFAAYVDGRCVVDLWGGNKRADRPWKQDTLSTLFSASKPLVILCAQVLYDRGELDLNAPVIEYWPEFGQAGKERTLVRHILTHSSGVVALDDPESFLKLDGTGFDNYDEIARQLAVAAPAWEPGTKSGYHGLTFGWLVGEVVRRVSGVTPGEFFRTEIAAPWALDLWVGAPENIHPRIADLHAPSMDGLTPDDMALGMAMGEVQADPASIMHRAALPLGGQYLLGNATQFFGSRMGRLAENASAGAVGSAHSLAKLYAALATGGQIDDVRLVSQETIDTFATEQSHRPAALLPDTFEVRLPSGSVARSPMERWGLGYQLRTAATPIIPYCLGPNEGTFGHTGMGGQFSLADPAVRLGIGFIRSHQVTHFRDGERLRDAVYACLAV